MSRRLSPIAALAFFAALAYSRVSNSQEPQANAAVLVNTLGVYWVDFAAGTAAALPIKAGVRTFVSPDRSMVAVLDTGGLTIYTVAGGQLRNLGNLTKSLDAQAAWAADSSELAFLRLDGDKTQVCIWSRATGAVRVLL